MKKPLLLEVSAPDVRVLEEIKDPSTGESALRVAVKWQHAGVINGNGRRYRKEILQREIERLRPMMEKGMIFGATYHPQQGDAAVDDVSHIWESATIEPDGACVGVIKVLPTARGKNAQAIIRHGGRIGMSSRGYGTVTVKEETVDGKEVKVEEVNDDFVLKSFGDLVLTPSVPDAGTLSILEAHFEKEDGASDSKEENRMYKDLQELRAAQPELLAPLDDEIKNLTEKNKAFEEEIAKLKTQMEESTALVDDLKTLVRVHVTGVREVVSNLTELPGVVEKKKVTEQDDEEEPEEPEDETEELRAQLKAAQERIKELEAEIAKLKNQEEESRKAEELQTKTLEAVKEALAKEPREYQKLLEDELIRDGKPIVDGPEKVATAVQELKEKIARLKAQVLKDEIVRTGVDEKGRVENPDKTGVRLTEQQITSRWRLARAAGYKGTLEQYSKDVLNLS